MYKNKKQAYLFLLPVFIFMFLFLLFPFLVNVKNSFFDIKNVFDIKGTFVGINNYVDVFKDQKFHNALINTSILMILVIVFQVGFALVLALLVNRVSKLQTFYKVSYFIPIIISGAAIGLMFSMFYRWSPNPAKNGAINQLLMLLNKEPVKWISSDQGAKVVLLAVSIPVVWQYIGFYFVIFLTGLTTISNELLEASSIDGATELQKVFKIEIPLLQNIIRVVVVLAITGTLKVFDLPFILNEQAWPNHKNFFLGTLLNYTRNYDAIGKAAAFAVILVLFGVLLSAISNIIFKQNDDI